jgi:hypothetical protein
MDEGLRKTIETACTDLAIIVNTLRSYEDGHIRVIDWLNEADDAVLASTLFAAIIFLGLFTPYPEPSPGYPTS